MKVKQAADQRQTGFVAEQLRRSGMIKAEQSSRNGKQAISE
jgi:hypothetical protein